LFTVRLKAKSSVELVKLAVMVALLSEPTWPKASVGRVAPSRRNSVTPVSEWMMPIEVGL
jgi:hypothetical protein